MTKLLGDEEDDLRVAEEECRDAISQMLDSASPTEPVVTNCSTEDRKVWPVVEYMGKPIYKSTLVSELNGNPFLSKDRLTQIKNSVYFNNAEEYLAAANSSATCFLGLGSDCGVFFVEAYNVNQSSTVNAARTRNRACGHSGRPIPVSTGGDIGTWWLGRV